MVIKTIRPQYKISYVLDDDLQVSQVAGAYLPKTTDAPLSCLKAKTFEVGKNTYTWVDFDGRQCIHTAYV